MKINYSKILRDNLINVFRDVLKNIKNNSLKEGHHLYITFKTNNKDVVIPNWLKKKFPHNMTIVIQYEYWNFKISKNYFEITLSFNDIKSDLKIPYNAVISFADPYANFGLKLINQKSNDKMSKTSSDKKSINTTNHTKKNNVIEFNKFKKN